MSGRRNEDSNLASFLGGSSAAALSGATSEALAIAFAGGAAAGGRSTTDAFDGGEDEDFAKAALVGRTTNGRGFANAVTGYGLFECTGTSDEDAVFAKALVAGGGNTTRRGTRDAFAE